MLSLFYSMDGWPVIVLGDIPRSVRAVLGASLGFGMRIAQLNDAWSMASSHRLDQNREL
jgi:hypothetical protein